MVNPSTKAWPDDLAKDVHQTLKSWHTHHIATQLDNFLYTYRLQEKENSDNQHLIINRFLINALNRLEKTNAAAAELLSHRFLDQKTAQEIAFRLNTSNNAVYQRQRTAIEHLTGIVWDLETEARELQADRIALRLPPPAYTKLFGVDEKLTTVRERVEALSEPWLLALEGMGGIGKTTLADALARTLASQARFKEIAWLSARQQLFRMPGQIEDIAPEANLSLDHLLDQLIEQMGLSALARASDHKKRLGVRSDLKRTPTLVIVDNLETLEDYRAIVPQLREFANPSKFLITTRYSLRGESGVYLLTLKGLSLTATRAFVNYEAQTQGLPHLAQASEGELARLHTITGGNPLAIRLIIGQSHTFSLVALLEQVDVIAGHAGQELLSYIHTDAWDRLDPQSRDVMRTMLLVPDAGGPIDHIVATSGLTMAEVASSLHHLTSHSLIQVQDEGDQRYYRMHPLTRQFVASQ